MVISVKVYALLFPVAFFVFLLVADRPFPGFLPGLTSSELGLLENIQALVLLAAACCGGGMIWRRGLRRDWLSAWLLIGVLGAVYSLLEEISYGQHYFGWVTPEVWDAVNDQHETNFHNTSSWFDQKPRLLLEVGVIVGGIVVPALRCFRPQVLPPKLSLILPENALLTTAVLAELPRVYERLIALAGFHDWNLFYRTSEVQEFYFFYFVLIYFVMLRKKLAAEGRG